MTTTETKPECKRCCPCQYMMGLLVVLFGLTFLLRELGVISNHFASITWPIIVIVAGLKALFGHMCKCCRKE